MSTRFERKSKKIDEKKAEITKEYMDRYCKVKNKNSKKDIKKDLKKYARKISRLEKKKYGIHKHINIKETKNDDIYGNFGYGRHLVNPYLNEKDDLKVRIGSDMKLNYNKVMPYIKSDDMDDRLVGFLRFAETVHHELGHLEQHIAVDKSKKIKDIKPEYVYKYALEFLGINYKGKEYYKKGDNYNKMFTETNAREKGLDGVSNMLLKLHMKGLNKRYVKWKSEKVMRDEFVELEDLEGKHGLEERFILTRNIADEAMRKNPNYLKVLPALDLAYTKDGERKSLYNIVRDDSSQTMKIKLNPFISKNKKKEKVEEIHDMYSEIFTSKLENCTENEYRYATQMVGKKSMKKMIEISADHYEKKYNGYIDSAKTEKELRTYFDEDSPSKINRVYMNRLEYNDSRYAPYMDLLNEAYSYTKNMNVKKLSGSEIRKRLKNDRQKINENYKNRKHNKVQTKEKNYVDEITEEDLHIDLEAMRSLKESYLEYEKYNKAKLEELKYKENMEKEKNKVVHNKDR